MPIFQYVVLNQKGKTLSSLYLADSKNEVIDELNRRGNYLVSIHEIEKIPRIKKISSTKIYQLTEEIHLFLKAKIPLFDAIKNIQKKQTDKNLQILLIALLDEMKKGKLFSEALKGYPKLFDPVYQAIVKAGEESGNLQASMCALKEILGKSLQVQKKVAAQLAYPKILAFISFLLIVGVLTFLVPSFKELIDAKKNSGISKMVFDLSDALLAYPHFFVLGIFSFISMMFVLKKTTIYQKQAEKIKLEWFPFKNFYIPSIFLRFSMVFETLLEASIPIIDALKNVKQVIGHPLIEKEIDRMIEKMKEGSKFSHALKNTQYIPDLICQIILSRDETGDYLQAFKMIRGIYEEELEKNLQQLSTYIQPVMFLLLGFIIGLIILSVLVPLTDATNFQI